MAKIADKFSQYQVAPGVLGVSPSMKEVGTKVKIVAADKITYDTILVAGETGTGKDVTARAIYNVFKSRKEKIAETSKEELPKIPFVHVPICAISLELLESELFGHKKGAFTNAIADRTGLIKSADGGVLYLDEIGDLPTTLQVKLLHFIQYRLVRPVGCNNEEKVKVKLILGTHCNLLEKVENKEFRQDLFYRIANVIIKLPALRDRKEDIPTFVGNHLSLANGGIVIKESALHYLENYPWLGNVRQLLSVIDNAILALEQRSNGNEEVKEILKKDINTLIFDANDPEKFNNLLITPNEETILLNAIKNGLTYKNCKTLYKRLLLTRVPGTITDKSRLSGRASIYRWQEELKIESVEFPEEEEESEKAKV